MRYLLITIALASLSLPVFSQTTGDKRRQFDFWIGEWDVNLRVRQKDNTWLDKHKSVARIYPILNGKAILELWSENETGINGYSLRYYNPKKGVWDLWLNWAGNNRSGTNGMECIFRHKRAECFSKRRINESTNLISRYTFSDAHSGSVRWDDAYSRDGGKTWSNNWIMEFTRRQKAAPSFDSTPKLLTYFNGKRCSANEFQVLSQISEKHTNNGSLKLYNILDGCIVIGLIETRKTRSYFTLTYNTFAKLYELAYIDDQSSSAMAMYYGNKTETGFELQSRASGKKKPGRASIRLDGGITSLMVDYEGKKRSLKF